MNQNQNGYEGLNIGLVFALMELEGTILESKYYGKIFKGVYVHRESYKISTTPSLQNLIQITFQTYDTMKDVDVENVERDLIVNLVLSFMNGGKFRKYVGSYSYMCKRGTEHKQKTDELINKFEDKYKFFRCFNGTIVGFGRGSGFIKIEDQDKLQDFIKEVLIPAIEKYGRKKYE